MRRQRPDRRARIEALRARQAALKERIRTRRPAKRRRWRRWALLAALLLLLFLLRDCRCAPEPALPTPAPAKAPSVEEAPEPDPVPRPVPNLQMKRLDRPEIAIPAPRKLPWLDVFRMQVAARSPRLAACFVGMDHPGQLRWTTSVEPVTGRVSDHTLDPILLTGTLTRSQQECVFEVLETPPYRLSPEGRATPTRVGLVIEF